MGDQFCLIGPYKEHCARTEVEECPFTHPALCEAVEALRQKGFKVVVVKEYEVSGICIILVVFELRNFFIASQDKCMNWVS